MAQGAKVQDIETLKNFRISLLNFAEKTTTSLGEADAEVQRVAMWLEGEAASHWASEQRKRQDALMKAREALRYKQVFKSPTGGKQSTVDEERAVALATKRVAEAEQKIISIKKWIRQLNKETHHYRGAVQRLGTSVSSDLPNAAAKISRMITALEGYVALTAPTTGPSFEGGESSGMSMGTQAPELRTGYKNLRKTTPDAAARNQVAPAVETAVEWTAGEFAVGNAEAFEKLAVERESLDPAAIIVVATGAATARRIYLERSPAAFPGDSGWYIGAAEWAAPTALESVKAADLFKARPHFAGLLSLPTGTLIVIDAAGVAALLTGQDEDLWLEEPASEETKATPVT